jgi:hypothetical protein
MRALTLGLMWVLGCRGAADPEETRREIAQVTSIAGTVEVLRGSAAEWRPLQRLARLYDDDRVRTYKGAFALLAFPGGSNLRVDEESLIALGSGVFVEKGSVGGELQPGLKVKTPALEAESAQRRDIVIQ